MGINFLNDILLEIPSHFFGLFSYKLTHFIQPNLLTIPLNCISKGENEQFKQK